MDHPTTITKVTVNHGFDVEQSCGHNYHLASTVSPVIGQVHDCLSCWSDDMDRRHPPLPEDQVNAIYAGLPKCPTCGSDIDTIPFAKSTIHKMQYEVDGHTGDVSAYSEEYDTLSEHPDWEGYPTVSHTKTGWEHSGLIQVACAEGHFWQEKRLVHVYNVKMNEYSWRIKDA